MKKLTLITIVLFLSILQLSAAKGFGVKIYDQNNIHFMDVAVDYDNNKVKVITNDVELDYLILYRAVAEDRSFLSLRVIQVRIFNNGNYDEKNVETFNFDLNKQLFSSVGSSKEFKYEMYTLEKNL